jgi:hypothetical protein
MYQMNSFLIALVLLVTMVIAVEIGYKFGQKKGSAANSATKSHVDAIQSSILGILALLLGFTFSLSLERFDSRSQAVVNEANAIGTASLRAQLLPQEVRQEVKTQMKQYIDLRIQESAISLAEPEARQALLDKTIKAQNALWALATQASEIDPNAVKTGLFIQALNEVFDNFSARNANLDRHVPEEVLSLLYVTFLMAGAIIGYASGFSKHRPSVVSYIMVMLIVMLVYLILDLDKPRRGWIAVSQAPLISLKSATE